MENKDSTRSTFENKMTNKRSLKSDSGTATNISKNEEKESPKKKKAKVSLEIKSPVMALHELKPNLKYEVSVLQIKNNINENPHNFIS